MKYLVCCPGPATAEAAMALASALDSRVIGLQSSPVDISALVVSDAVRSPSFVDDVEVAVIYAPPEFCDDVWRVYGLISFAHSLLSLLSYVCFYGRGESTLIDSARIPVFASNDEEGLRGLVTFIEAARRREPATSSPISDGVPERVSRSWSVQPAHSIQDAAARRQELLSLRTSPVAKH